MLRVLLGDTGCVTSSRGFLVFILPSHLVGPPYRGVPLPPPHVLNKLSQARQPTFKFFLARGGKHEFKEPRAFVPRAHPRSERQSVILHQGQVRLELVLLLLLGAQGAESGKKFVGDSSCIVEKGADDALDPFDTFVRERGTVCL